MPESTSKYICSEPEIRVKKTREAFALIIISRKGRFVKKKVRSSHTTQVNHGEKLSLSHINISVKE